MIIPIILAGGSGTRLWPLSRQFYPKQLLALFNDYTLLQNTVLRLDGLQGLQEPILVCSEEHRFFVAEQMRSIRVKPSCIILEPFGRNTAPAVAVAALKALQAPDDPLLLVLPADHYLADARPFQDAIKTGSELAREGFLVTFGIVPSTPETGYGYIKMGSPIAMGGDGPDAMRIERFVEKPEREVAEEYLRSGGYLWNSGMFMFSASRILEELERFSPEILTHCKNALEKGVHDMDFFRLERSAFEVCPGNSLDFAVMERTEQGAVIPMDTGWNDVGSWDALWMISSKDENDNVTLGDVVIQDVKNSYLHATNRLVVAIGVEDCVIVETADAVLVSPRHKIQGVKQIVERLKAHQRDEACNHRKVFRPWGAYECVDVDQRFQVKRITIKPGAKLSLQKHYHRAEHWIVVKGTALVMKGSEQLMLTEDQSTYIPAGTDHRLENPGKIPLEIIEVQTGSYLGEDDIVRLEDIYGR